VYLLGRLAAFATAWCDGAAASAAALLGFAIASDPA